MVRRWFEFWREKGFLVVLDPMNAPKDVLNQQGMIFYPKIWIRSGVVVQNLEIG